MTGPKARRRSVGPPFIGITGVAENLREEPTHAPSAPPRLATVQRWRTIAVECDWDYRSPSARARADVATAAIGAYIGA